MMLYSSLVEQAMRFAADRHRTQVRKQTDIPYLTHLAGVTLILARVGFDDDELLAAALLHDAVEDADVASAEVAETFGPRVAALVDAVSEVKQDAAGVTLPWRTRKEEFLGRLRGAAVEAKAIALADKLHNLGTLVDDLTVDATAWSRFNTGAAEQIWFYESVLDAVGADHRLARLVDDCRIMLDRLRRHVPQGA